MRHFFLLPLIYFLFFCCFFFFNDTATTEIYTLSLHDALPISRWVRPRERTPSRCSGASRVRHCQMPNAACVRGASYVAPCSRWAGPSPAYSVVVVLSDRDIRAAIDAGRIGIDPFDPKCA